MPLGDTFVPTIAPQQIPQTHCPRFPNLSQKVKFMESTVARLPTLDTIQRTVHTENYNAFHYMYANAANVYS